MAIFKLDQAPPPLRPIALLTPAELLPTIDSDLATTTGLDAYIYSADHHYLRVVFGPLFGRMPIRLIVDHKHRSEVSVLNGQFPFFSVRSYSSNRTMHDKTFLLHGKGIVYLLTANMNRGSFMLSKNRAARVSQEHFYFEIAAEFEADWKNSRPIPYRQPPAV